MRLDGCAFDQRSVRFGNFLTRPSAGSRGRSSCSYTPTDRPATENTAPPFHNLAIECAGFRRMISTGIGCVHRSLARDHHNGSGRHGRHDPCSWRKRLEADQPVDWSAVPSNTSDLAGPHSPAPGDPRQAETPLIDCLRSTVLGPEFMNGRLFVPLENARVKQDIMAFDVCASPIQRSWLTPVDEIIAYDQDISTAGGQLRHQRMVPRCRRQGRNRCDKCLLKTA